jgi:hypothetical protein
MIPLRLTVADWIMQFVLDEATRMGLTLTVKDLNDAVVNRCQLFKVDPENRTLITAEELFNLLDSRLTNAVLTR